MFQKLTKKKPLTQWFFKVSKKLSNIWATFVRTFVQKKLLNIAQSGHTACCAT